MADLSRRPDGHFTIHLDPGDNTAPTSKASR